MGRFVAFVAVLLAIVMGGSVCWAARTAATPEEITTWTRHIIPLPKQVQILGKVGVQCADVSVVLPSSSDVKVPQARRELRQALGLPQNGDDPSAPVFTITLQLGGTESADLAALANSDQAYKIFPEAGDTGLRLVALEPAGLYYAAKTLSQMLPYKRSGGSVQIPIIQITDWPDMADRGLWGCDHFAWLKWMGDRKMNIGEQISAREVRSDLRGYSYLKEGREPMVTEGPYYNVQPVPVVLHLEQISSCGLFTYYPQVIGVGGQPGCICYSNGAFTHVLADWIVDLASLPHVDGVDVWMAENLHGQGGCQCTACRLHDRNVLEAQTIVAAWEEAKARLGRYIKLWILTSEETYQSNTAVFNAVPSDVRIWYYHSLYTYITGRHEMVPNNVAYVASTGRYAGVCPMISSTANQPFSSPEYMKLRMGEFVTKKMSGLIGYAVPPPLVHFAGYIVEAEAEYAWNAAGRSTHEFAMSHAVREGYSDPETFAEWSEAIGTLELDLYGSDWPNGEGRYSPGYVADCLQKGTLPSLGTAYAGYRGPWAEFKSAQQFDDDIARSTKAIALAKQMGRDDHYYESLYADGLIKSLRALYKLRSLVVGGTVSPANRETAQFYFGVYINSIKQSIYAVQKWSIAVNGDTGFVQSTVNKLQQCISGNSEGNPGMLKVASDCGCTPTLPYNAEPATTIADAKRLGPGAVVSLYGDLVTGGIGATCFVQERDRTCAIRVNTPAALTSSAPALVFGTVENVDGELRINAEVVQSAGSPEAVKPLAVSLRNLGGGTFGSQPPVMEWRFVKEDGKWVRRLLPVDGLNNLGLFVRVSGIVNYVGSDYFYIDDGSHCDDDSGHYGVRVICADGAWDKPALGECVTINGMSSAYFERGYAWRALFVPVPTNIVVIPVPLELIMDEDQATATGTWTYTPSASGAAYNDDYEQAATAATETATARWTPNITRPGNYDVYVMHCAGPDRTTGAPFTVVYDGGSETFHIDQTTNGGTWQLLGRWPFAIGNSGYVQVGSATADPGKVVVADAVRFVRASGGTPPSFTAHPSPSPNAVCIGANAAFSVTATGSSPLTYQWRKGSVNISDGGHYSGAKTSVLTVSSCDLSDAAPDYNCVVTNMYGSVVSNNAVLLVGDTSVAPSALPATGIEIDRVTWNWTAAPGAYGYSLWTAATGGTSVGGLISGTSYTETGMDPGTQCARYVQAEYGCGASATRTELGPATTTPRYCVQNGDFESGFTAGIGNYWTRSHNEPTSTFAQDTTIKRGGTSSQRIKDPVGAPTFTPWLYQKINVQPGRGYSYQLYSLRDTASGAICQLGVSYTGTTTADGTWDSTGAANEWRFKAANFTSGATGLVTLMFRVGYNKNHTAYIDDVILRPQAPTTAGGAATIGPGESATLTASGGFGGTDEELHWYTGAGGTGTHVGTGLSLVVSPTATTTYYPRWESSLCPGNTAPSDDGPSVTVTVAEPLSRQLLKK